MSDSTLKLEISEGDIRNAIAVALAESFGPDKRDALLRDIVRAHLAYKETSYDKDTLLSKAVGRMVRQVAEEQIRASFDTELAGRVREVVAGHFNPKFCDGIVNSVKDAIESVTVRGLRFSADVISDGDE